MAGWLRRIARSALSWETPGSWPALLRDGRTWLIGLTGAGLALLLAGIAREGWAAGWDLFRVGAFRTGFSDLAVILAGFDCTRLGHDVQLENPCDPFGQRPMNYPRIWLALRASGLGLGDTVWLGTVLGALFVLAALAFLCRRRLSPGEGVLGALILLSPSVLLGVERANGDLLLFLLVLGAALLVARGGARLAGGLGLVFAGAMLKLYPIAAAASALLHRRGWRIVVVTVALFAVYAAATRNDIRRVSAATPRPVHLAYGSAVLPTAWAARVAQRDPGTMNRLRPWVRVAGWGVPAVLLGIAILLSPRSGPVELSSDAAGAAFLAGAGIYGLTYVLGNNWDYRLIFLILCLPMLWQWGRREDASGTWSVLILGSMAASFWLGPSDRRIWFVDEIFNAVAWLGLAVLTLAWLRARRASA